MRILTHGLMMAALASAAATLPAHADDVIAGQISIAQPWSRATPGGAKVAGGYLTIENRGSAPDRLLSASSDVARRIEIHQTILHDGIMAMRPVEGGLPLEPGRRASLAPGGAHLMFLELKAPLRQGERIPVTLNFERAGIVTIMFDIQAMAAQAPAQPIAPIEAKAPASDADESFFTHLHAEKAMANVTVSPGRAGPVDIEIQLEDANEAPLAADAVSVTLDNSENGIAPVTANARRIGADRWMVQMSAPLSGRWSLALGITISPTDKVDVASPILLR